MVSIFSVWLKKAFDGLKPLSLFIFFLFIFVNSFATEKSQSLKLERSKISETENFLKKITGFYLQEKDILKSFKSSQQLPFSEQTKKAIIFMSIGLIFLVFAKPKWELNPVFWAVGAIFFLIGAFLLLFDILGLTF